MNDAQTAPMLPPVDTSAGTPLEVFLTRQERQVFEYIRTYTADQGICPSAWEVADALKIHRRDIYRIIGSLVTAGAIRHKHKQVRAWKIVANVVVYEIPAARK